MLTVSLTAAQNKCTLCDRSDSCKESSRHIRLALAAHSNSFAGSAALVLISLLQDASHPGGSNLCCSTIL